MKKDNVINNQKVNNKKVSKNNNKLIYTFFSLILVISSLLFVGLIYYMNILPILYNIIILGVVLVIDFLLFSFLNFRKIKKSIKGKSLIFAIIFSIIFIIIDFNIFKTVNFLSDIKADDSKTLNFSVLVLSDSSYSSIDDLENKKVGYYANNEDANENITTSVDFDSFTDLNNMYKALFNGTVKAIIIEDSLKGMTEDENDTYNSKTKVIYTFSIVQKSDTAAKTVDVTNKTFNLYISGIDTYGPISSVSRSDVNIIATINPKTKKILLTSIPRDYYVQLSGKTGLKDKLTHAGIYGVDESIGTIENLLGIDINYYMKVNFTSVVDIVDTIGGLNVYSDYAFTSMDGYTYKVGYNTMNGAKTLSFARERHSFQDGDRQRGKDQELVIKALVAKLTSPAILAKYDTLLSKLSSKIATNMSQKEILSLVKLQLSNNTAWTIDTNSLDGTNGSEYTYSYSSQKLYVMIPDQKSIDNAKELIEEAY